MEKIKFKNPKKYKGIVEKVFVKEGQPIKKGEKLAVISTQLDKYDINSPIEGIVRNVYLIETLIVSHGDTVFDIFTGKEIKNLLKKPANINETMRDGLMEFGYLENLNKEISSGDTEENEETLELNDEETSELNDEEKSELNDEETSELNDEETSELNDEEKSELNDEEKSELNDEETAELNDEETADSTFEETDSVNGGSDLTFSDLQTSDIIIDELKDQEIEEIDEIENETEEIDEKENETEEIEFTKDLDLFEENTSDLENEQKVDEYEEVSVSKSFDQIQEDFKDDLTNEEKKHDFVENKNVKSEIDPINVSDSITEELDISNSILLEEEKDLENNFADAESKKENQPVEENLDEKINLTEKHVQNQSQALEEETFNVTSSVIHSSEENNTFFSEKLSQEQPRLESPKSSSDEFRSSQEKGSDQKMSKIKYLYEIDNQKIEKLVATNSNLKDEVNVLKVREGELSSKLDDLSEQLKTLEEKIIANVSSIGVTPNEFESKLVFAKTNTSSFSFNLDVTALISLQTLMIDPFKDYGLDLGLNSFYVKAMKKALNKFKELDSNDSSIRLVKTDGLRIIDTLVHLQEDESILNICKEIMKNNFNESQTSKVTIFDFSEFGISNVNLGIAKNSVLSVYISSIVNSFKEDGSLSNFVKITFVYNQNVLEPEDAILFGKEFISKLKNPGFLI